MSATGTTFFQTQNYPPMAFLSEASISALEHYLTDGNPKLREHKLEEFFKAVDWMPIDDIPNTPLKKLPLPARNQVMADLKEYLAAKRTKRNQDQERQREYKFRVMAYYKERLCRKDKVLLEALRDFELNLTGRDTNWQHHFGLKSFKRVDAFATASSQERSQWIEAFQNDVLTYKKNLEKLKRQEAFYRQFGEEGPSLSFDEWCDMMGDTVDCSQQSSQFHQRQRSRPPQEMGPVRTPAQACHVLSVALDSPWKDVKRQFRQLSLKHHPDMPGGNEEAMKQLVAAYDILKKHHAHMPAGAPS